MSLKFIHKGKQTYIYAYDGKIIGWISSKGTADLAVLYLHTHGIEGILGENGAAHIIAEMENAAVTKNLSYFKEFKQSANKEDN